MIAIVLDILAAYLLRRYFSTKFQYFFMGVIAGVINATIGAFLVGIWLDEPPGTVLMGALSGALYHTLFIFLFLFCDLRFIAKKSKREALKAEDKYWDANGERIITDVLKNHQGIDLSVASRNEILEENLTRLSTEEIIERIQKKHFSDDAIPSALRVLNSRKKS